ncbi:MAG: polysaccharide deacetylase family protein [bacterium]|nr:polysaccharide deacetylase family protein [bacterium]
MNIKINTKQKREKGTSSGTKPFLLPLSPAHLAGLGAYQTALVLFCLNPVYIAWPLSFYLFLCLITPFLPRFAFFLPIISKGKSNTKGVALTFDDGPDPIVTPKMLDLLKKHSVKATFFVIGEKAEKYPELIKRILREGHDIGNHSYSHDPFLMTRNPKQLLHDIKSTGEVLNKFGIEALAFRPPVGITNPRLWKVLLKLGMYCINYSCRAYDRGNRHINELASRIIRKTVAGDIVLLHDKVPKKFGDMEGDSEEWLNQWLAQWLNEVELIITGIRKKDLKILSIQDLTGKAVMVKKEEGLLSNSITSFYNSLALEYDKEQLKSAVSIARKKEFDIVSSRFDELLTPASRVLEIGAGTGIYTIPIATLAGSATAIDISKNMIDILKKKGQAAGLTNLDYKTGDIGNILSDMPFFDIQDKIQEGTTYDIICAFSVFEYITDLHTIVNKLYDCLNPGGILYFTTANRSLFRFFTQVGNAMRQGVWLHARSSKEIKTILMTNGFTNIDISTHLFKSYISKGMILEVFAKKQEFELAYPVASQSQKTLDTKNII